MKKILWCLLFCAATWCVGLAWYVAQIPTNPSSDDTPADAIVVLTGGSKRLELGLQLLAQGKGKALFISGASEDFSVAQLLRMTTPPVRAAIAQLPKESIALGRQAKNTIGNAEETSHWLEKKKYIRIRLVTANYHLPRSISEFAQVTPALTIIPEPVFTEDFPARWWENKSSRKLLLSEYHKFLAGKLRHLLIASTQKQST